MLSIPERYAHRNTVRKLALELMTRHGLHDWNFGFNRRKRAMGLCRYAARTIELSIYLVDRNGAEEVRDTILHEIAHALVGSEHGHDAVWKRKCLEIGAKPERCGQADMPSGRWQACCGSCGRIFARHRRPKRLQGWFCRMCGPQRGGLAWREIVKKNLTQRRKERKEKN
ncbi:MAG TPA: SprT-like domain-containing protein [Gemmataceae bacterium]|jgi:predicted SprT family Zn-dependent metalloprotease